jgi:EmrB/QacA subfamily drug resistance transporter
VKRKIAARSTVTDIVEKPTRTTDASIDSRRWYTLIVLAMCTLVISVDNTILNVALPTITRQLGASASQLQWVIDAYTMVFACLLLVAGALGDRFGRRLTLIVGLAWFALFAVFSAFGSSPGHLIAGRGLMGLGAACIFPSTLSILTTSFPDPRERAKAIGVWASVSSLSMVIGPLSGGLLVDHFGWHSVFLINVPFCVLAIVGAVLFVPKGRREKNVPLDPIGALLSILAVGFLLLAIIQAPDWGWTSPAVVAATAVAAMLGYAFVRWERSFDHPMIDISLFSNRMFSSASLAVTLAFFASFGASLLTTVYFQSVQGFSALRTGVMMMPIAAAMMVIGPNVAKLVQRLGTRDVMSIGISILVVGTFMHSFNAVMSSLWLGLLARFLLGAGMGLLMPPATMAIMSAVPPERAGVGSAMNDTTRQTGGALGVAILGSIVAGAYRLHFRTPANVAADVGANARESIGRALVAASKLPAGEGDALRSAARHAFINAVRYGYWMSAVVLLFTLWFVRRNVPLMRLEHRMAKVRDELQAQARAAEASTSG